MRKDPYNPSQTGCAAAQLIDSQRIGGGQADENQVVTSSATSKTLPHRLHSVCSRVVLCLLLSAPLLSACTKPEPAPTEDTLDIFDPTRSDSVAPNGQTLGITIEIDTAWAGQTHSTY